MKKFFLLFLLVYSTSLWADEIHLIDGKIINGNIINVTTDSIEYKREDDSTQKLNRSSVVKITYKNGKEIDFFDRIFLKDGSSIPAKVIKSGKLYIEYKPLGEIPYDRVETENVTKIVYDNGIVENFANQAETDMIFLKDGSTFKAGNIIIREKYIEFTDEKSNRLFYGRDMVLKIVYKNGTVETPEKFKNSAGQTAAGVSLYTGNMFWEFELGWNGYTGLGARVDYRLIDNFGINAGAGVGLWGYRFSGALRYYLEYPFGLAFSIGAAYNTGLKSYTYSYETENKSGNKIKEDVNFTCKPVTTINATLLYFWRVNGNNRLYIEAGYAYAMQKTKYTYTTASGNSLTTDSKNTEDIIAPGGIILTIGYAFAI